MVGNRPESLSWQVQTSLGEIQSSEQIRGSNGKNPAAVSQEVTSTSPELLNSRALTGHGCQDTHIVKDLHGRSDVELAMLSAIAFARHNGC